jgi:hypothetical protein
MDSLPTDPFVSDRAREFFIIARWLDLASMGYAGYQKFGLGAVVFEVDRNYLNYIPSANLHDEYSQSALRKLDPKEGIYLILADVRRSLNHKGIYSGFHISPKEAFWINQKIQQTRLRSTRLN